jgi:hypothetical protein
MTSQDPLEIAKSIGDRFISWQGASGRPDPDKCPYVTTSYGFSPVNGHCPPSMAKALYLLFDRTGDLRYKDAADRYAIFCFCYPRDPVPPVEDRQRSLRLNRIMNTNSLVNAQYASNQMDPRISNHPQSRAWMYGAALSPAYYEFRRHNPKEECYDARADALFDWLQKHRTDRGQAYNIGYPVVHHPDMDDAAYTDDLRLVGTGLVGYYELTKRQDVLESAIRLADYYLRAHRADTPDGAFLESLGTWCIGPWPVAISIEHFSDFRVDQAGWGWTARGAVEFLTSLHTCLPADHPRANLMRDRCTRSVQWQFSCQFDDGAVGMYTEDDYWLGMTAAALLAYADIYKVGWVDDNLAALLVPKVIRAKAWLLENTTEEMINQGGYRKVTGKTTPWPPENLAWLLAWTIEALLRMGEV